MTELETTDAVTFREQTGDMANPETASGEGGNAGARRARARDGMVPVLPAVTERGRELVQVVRRVATGGGSLWDEGLPSPGMVLDYTRAGEWVRGDQAPWLEVAGKAYGYLVALPLTIAATYLTWPFQRLLRALLTVAIAGLLVLTLAVTR